jgi:phage-related baseplate assembly protein
VRPMTDQVTVLSASIVNYSVQAQLTIYPGPDPDVVRQTALDAVASYVAAQRRIGFDITRSGLFAALHQPGVQNVTLTSPAADVEISEGQAGYCTAITVTVGGTGV